MEDVVSAFAAILSLILKLSDGQIDFAAVPTFVFWLKIGPPVATLLVIFLILLIALPFSFRSSNRSNLPYNADQVAENGYTPDPRPEDAEIMIQKSRCCPLCCCCFGRRKRKNSQPTTILMQQVPATIPNPDPGQGSIIDSDLEDDGLIVVYNQAADSSATTPTATMQVAKPEIPLPESPSLILGSISPRPQKPQRRKFGVKTSCSESEPSHLYEPTDSSKYDYVGKQVPDVPELNLKLTQRCPSSSAISSSSSSNSREPATVESETDNRDKPIDLDHLPDMSDEPLPLGSLILTNKLTLRPTTSSHPPIPAKPTTKSPLKPHIPFTPSRPPASSSVMPASSTSNDSTTKEPSSDSTSDGESGVSLNCDEGGTTDSQSISSLTPESELSKSLKRNARLRDLVRDNDLEVIDEFSHTMERLKLMLEDEEARILEESVSKIEQIVSNSDRVPRISMSANVGSHAQLDNIMSDLESVMEDIDTWE